jgi:hypothetical protein
MTNATDPTWPVARSGHANREVAWSGHLARLANEAAADGFPFTAEHLQHLASYVLDEAAMKYCGRPSDRDGGGLTPN